ncbi:MAG: hypothetical protein AAF171_19465 [Cyanobacteria bacterium P01_A01_bin.116]
MMATLEDALSYILQKQLKRLNGISPNKLIRILYLADWRSSINTGHPITNVNWKIVDSEPQLDKGSIERIVDFIERNGRTINLGISETYRKVFSEGLSMGDKSILDFVLNLSASQSEDALAHLVYSTYPSITQNSDDAIDLPKLAKQYEALQPILKAG